MNVRAQIASLAIAVFAFSAICFSTTAQATNYSLWINGRSNSAQVGNYNDFSYWGPAATAGGVNKKAVNWDGYNSIANQNGVVRNALDCFCTGSNWCYIATHSTGDLMLGYTLAMYGGSARAIKAPTPAANGTCSNASSANTTQTGWNIKWVNAAGGAAGGTTLADVGSLVLSEPIVSDLKTSTARALYDHNNTRGTTFYMFAGAKGTLYSAILVGQDDEVIEYHSSGAVSGSTKGNYCNPGDWFCDVLALGTAANSNGRAKWTNHSVQLRDNGQIYNHYAAGNWGGIIAPMRTDMVNYAQ
jgi:hypothetical protein